MMMMNGDGAARQKTTVAGIKRLKPRGNNDCLKPRFVEFKE
jgi:hypothetical protein